MFLKYLIYYLYSVQNVQKINLALQILYSFNCVVLIHS